MSPANLLIANINELRRVSARARAQGVIRNEPDITNDADMRRIAIWAAEPPQKPEGGATLFHTQTHTCTLVAILMFLLLSCGDLLLI